MPARVVARSKARGIPLGDINVQLGEQGKIKIAFLLIRRVQMDISYKTLAVIDNDVCIPIEINLCSDIMERAFRCM